MNSADKRPLPEISGADYVISREFGVPRERVFKAWTDSKLMAEWWGQKAFTNPVCNLDAKPGGDYRIVMRSPEGAEYPCRGKYLSLVENERLEMTIDCAEYPEEWFDLLFPGRDHTKAKPELIIPMTVTFEEGGGISRMTVRLHYESSALRDAMLGVGMNEGWTESLDSLSELLGDFVHSREFDAPRQLVWRANTESEHLARWWGPKGCVWAGCKMEFQPGGSFHYCLSVPNGGEMWGRFIYLDIVSPEKIIYVSSFSDETGGVTRHPLSKTWPLGIINTLTLIERNGKTTLTLRGFPLNASQEERDTFRSEREGTKTALSRMWDQLAEYLKSIKA